MAEEKLKPQYDAIEREYARHVRMVDARPRLEAAGLFLWALVDVALIVFFIITVVFYVVSGSFADERSVATVATNAGVAHETALARAAEPMVVEDARVLARDTDSYDLYSIIENPNDEWYATFDYYFDTGSQTTPVAQGSLMPGETRYLLGLDVDADSRPAGAEVMIEDVVWERVDRHAIENTAEFLLNHNDFTVSDSAYAVDVALSEDSVGRSTFTITNETAYSYVNPTFTVLLKKSGVLVAINQVSLSQFVTGESRPISVHWFGTVPTNATVEVLPTINYFDEDEYMSPPGEISEDIRDIFEDR